jgi:hypothetical protein
MKKAFIVTTVICLISSLVSGQKPEKRQLVKGMVDSLSAQTRAKETFTMLGTQFEIDKNEQLIPSQYFDKYVLSDVQRFVVLNNEASIYPAFTLDALEKNISFSYSRVLGKPDEKKSTILGILPAAETKGMKRYSTISLGLKAEYDANSKSAAVYSSGGFVNNIKLNIHYSLFAKGRANYNAGNPANIFFEKLNEFILESENNNAKFETYKARQKQIENSGSDWDEKLWLAAQLEKKWDKASLLAQLDTFLLTKAPFYRRKLRWLTIGLNEIGTPSYKTFDINGKDDERFGDKRLFVIHPAVAYNWLRVRNKKVINSNAFSAGKLPEQKKKDETVFFFNLGGGMQLTSNIGQNGVKAKDYIEDKVVITGGGTTIYQQTNYKAYKREELSDFWRATFKEELLWLFIPKYKMGFNQSFEYFLPVGANNDDYKQQISHNLGWVFPIQNKKEKVTTLMQVYWKCSGFVETEFVNEFGLKLGIPINIPID